MNVCMFVFWKVLKKDDLLLASTIAFGFSQGSIWDWSSSWELHLDFATWAVCLWLIVLLLLQALLSAHISTYTLTLIPTLISSHHSIPEESPVSTFHFMSASPVVALRSQYSAAVGLQQRIDRIWLLKELATDFIIDLLCRTTITPLNKSQRCLSIKNFELSAEQR